MDYSKYIAKAREKIARFGREAVFQFEAGQYDPIAGEMAAEASEARAMAVMLNPDKKALASGDIELSDAMLLVSGDSLPETPQIGGIVEFAGTSYSIVSASQVSPDGAPILYKIYIRRA